MTDNDQEDQKSTFRVLDAGTMFTGCYFWEDTSGVMQCATGVWAMEDIDFVATIPDAILPDMPGPKCAVFISGDNLNLQAGFHEVQKAWRQYRRAKQVRNVFPFSGIVPFSAS